MTNVVIVGALGRMGQALRACAARTEGVLVAAAVDAGDNLGVAVPRGDVVIDFSFHAVTKQVADLCARHGKPLVIGTTGHPEAERTQIAALGSQIPMVWSSNYSTGVNALYWLVRKAAEILGQGYDLEVVEMHHRMKKDAPSGTAMTLAQVLAEVRKQQLSAVLRHGRHGITGERSSSEIGMHALRGGDVVGDHTVIFAAPGERVELAHKASNRETFAAGALRAAQWVVGKPPGIYTMQDVLGLA